MGAPDAPVKLPMRLIAWNIRGGARAGILKVVSTLDPDVLVLTDCRPAHYARIAQSLRLAGLEWATGTNEGNYTGILVASKTALEPGPTHSTVLPGRWCHITLPQLDTSILAIYGPLRRAGTPRLVSSFWAELREVGDQLASSNALIVGA